MGGRSSEMLKGVLEGMVLAILAQHPTYGYDITAQLRERGFTDIVVGTVSAILVRIERRGLVDVKRVPSDKGPARKVYALNAAGEHELREFWQAWSALSARIEELHGSEQGA